MLRPNNRYHAICVKLVSAWAAYNNEGTPKTTTTQTTSPLRPSHQNLNLSANKTKRAHAMTARMCEYQTLQSLRGFAWQQIATNPRLSTNNRIIMAERAAADIHETVDSQPVCTSARTHHPGSDPSARHETRQSPASAMSSHTCANQIPAKRFRQHCSMQGGSHEALKIIQGDTYTMRCHNPAPYTCPPHHIGQQLLHLKKSP